MHACYLLSSLSGLQLPLRAIAAAVCGTFDYTICHTINYATIALTIQTLKSRHRANNTSSTGGFNNKIIHVFYLILFSNKTIYFLAVRIAPTFVSFLANSFPYSLRKAPRLTQFCLAKILKRFIGE